MTVTRKPSGATCGGQYAATTRAEAEVDLFFHVAPESAHESIEQHGLDHTRGESAYADMRLDYPAGNYLFTDPDAATEYAQVREDEERDEYGPEAEAYTVYEVQLPSGTHVENDPFADDESGLGATAVYTPEPIPPDHIRGH